jgi:hypothetical protein
MTGPSERAVEAACVMHTATKRTGKDHARRVLVAASDPALGEDAYVRLGDVLAALERGYNPHGNHEARALTVHPADYIEREHREGRL